MAQIEDCRFIELPKISDHRGSLSFAEVGTHLPFTVQRIFYSYLVPKGASRGAHAHRELIQFFMVLGGSIQIQLDDGRDKKSFLIDVSNKGLLVPPGIWVDQSNFSTGAISLVLASDKYKESDYLRNYQEFLKFKGIHK